MINLFYVNLNCKESLYCFRYIFVSPFSYPAPAHARLSLAMFVDLRGIVSFFSLSILTPDTVQRSLNVLLMAEHIVCFLKSRFYTEVTEVG